MTVGCIWRSVRVWRKGSYAFACLVLVGGLALCCLGCAEVAAGRSRSSSSGFGEEPLFTRVNLRFDPRKGRGSFVGYTQLRLLPVNSEVRLVGTEADRFSLKLRSGHVVVFGYKEIWGGTGQKPIEEVLPQIFSREPHPVDLERMSPADRQGVELGIARLGMSKTGVVVALGSPPSHETPTLQDDVWTYWKNSFTRFFIRFADGVVVEVSDFKLK